MEKYIVKVQSYHGNECIEYGTGIMIAKNQVLTPKHVTCGDRHTVWIGNKECSAHITRQNNVAVVLEADQSHYSANVADIFSGDEILDEESMWSISGFISPQQREHSLNGIGISITPIKELDWDHQLAAISVGRADNYQGLSGSPVFCDNRIIGILQMQAHISSGALGVCISSVKMFQDLLPEVNCKPNAYKMQLKDACTQYTKTQIEKNVKSKKYIAEIFVEEGDYKEKLRYFADPMLFLKKAICNVKRIDFEGVNQHLRSNGEQEIGFDDLVEDLTPSELVETVTLLRDRISTTITCLEAIEKHNDTAITNLEGYFSIRQETNNSIRFYLSDIKDEIDCITKKYIMLTKDAGQGKTNFVCDFTLNFLLRKGYIVLYFNAYEFRENPMVSVKRMLSLNETYSSHYMRKVLIREWNSTQRPIVIIIDGLNENTLIGNFGQCMRDFLEECQAYPYIKVITTTRNEFLKERFAVIEEGTYAGAYKHIDMWQRSQNFKERIFWGYLSFFKITIRKNTLTQKSYDTLTDDVLLLRFFSEVNESKKHIYLYDVYKYDVFRQYLNRKSLEYQKDRQVLNHQDSLYALLDKISEYMIRKKTFFNIPSSIFNDAEQELLFLMLSNEVIFKDEQVVKTGLLKRNTVVISFTFDEFRDFCITNYVLTHLSEEKAFLAFWNQMNEGELTIREGVQKYIFYLARTESQNDLLPIIKTLLEFENLYWRYVWGLEDTYLDADDLAAWRAQLLTNGKYAKRIVHDLIHKCDSEYFVNVNISLLFEALNSLTDKLHLYDAFIKRMFGVDRRRRGSYVDSKPESVWPFNAMVQSITNCLDDDSWNMHHSEWYRLAIYLHEIDNRSSLSLWHKLYVVSPGLAVKILGEMNQHKSSLITCNVKEILQHLEKNRSGDEYDLQIERLIQGNPFGRDMPVGTAVQFVKLHLDEFGE